MRPTVQSRQYELDWLRLAAVCLVIFGHTAATYTGKNLYSWNETSSPALLAWSNATTYWRLPVLFFVAGAACAFALGSKPVRAYVRERVEKLVIPLAFALLTYQQLMRVLAARTSRALVDANILPASALVEGRAFGWGHLWFVAYLILMSALTIPLLVWLRRRDAAPAAAPAGPVVGDVGHARGTGRVAWVLAVAPLAVLAGAAVPDRALVGWHYTALFAPQLFASSFVLFILGLFYGRNAAFRDLLLRTRFFHLAAWAAVLVVEAFANPHPAPKSVAAYAVVATAAIKTWFWVALMLGFAKRHLAFSNAYLVALSEISYAAYLIHRVLIIILAGAIAPLGWPIAIEFPVLLVAVFATTYIFCKGIQSSPVARRLFGVRAPRRPAVATPAPALAAA